MNTKIYNTDIILKKHSFIRDLIKKSVDIFYTRSYNAEISVLFSVGINLNTRSNLIENITFKNDSVLKIKIFNSNSQGISYSNILNLQSVINSIDIAYELSKYTSKDQYLKLADKDSLAFNTKNLELFHPINLNVELASSITWNLENNINKYKLDFIKNDKESFNGQFNIYAIGNSYGLIQSYISSYYEVACSVIFNNTDGSMGSSYYYNVNRNFQYLQNSYKISKECVDRAILNRNPRKIKSMETSVIFFKDIVESLFFHLAEAINGENVYNNSTFLKNYLNVKIFPEWLSINEFPHLKQGLSSAPFDNEGVKTRNLIIVKNGVLRTWLTNSYSSRKLKMKNTGHANNRIYNWEIISKNSVLSFNNLLKRMGNGLVITDLIGSGFNVINGDYSRGVSCGFKVKNGNIDHAVHEITIAGNFLEMMKNIVDFSNDYNINSSIKCGSLLISSMKIAGK